jgi:DNA-binding GntR family transcriptional regulator
MAVLLEADGEPKRVRRQRLTVAGLAEEELREMVLDGRLAQGQRLNEVAIAEDLGISRGPLREAIQRLASEGLLTVVPHRGAFVRMLDEAELRQLYELRIAIETHAVRLGVEHCTPQQLQALEDALERTRKIFREEDEPHYPSDLDIHALLVSLADNEALLRAMHDTHARIHLARARSAYAPKRAQQAYREHVQIVAAIRDGKADDAAALLETHLRQSVENAAELIRSR